MSTSSSIANTLSQLCEIPFPSTCAGCGVAVGRDQPWCEPCAQSLVSGLEQACPSCGVVWLDPPAGGGGHLCGACTREPPPYRRARGLLAYGGAAQDAIGAWKNRPDETLGRTLASLLVHNAEALGLGHLERPLFVPVPSTRAALGRRGFNPASALARPLARALRAEYAPTALMFRRAPRSSRGLGRAERRERMRGVLVGRPGVVRGREVVLVDDVMTTGATAIAATRALLTAGAASVDVVVLARVPS